MSSGQNNTVDPKTLIEPFIEKKGGLIPALHALQEHLGYISKESITKLAIAFNYSQAEIIDVITFYDDFRTKPIGRNLIKICLAEACQSQNCKKLLKDISSQLNLTIDETNHDSGITLKEVFCLGNCAIGPSVMINETVIGEATAEKIISHLEEMVHRDNE